MSQTSGIALRICAFFSEKLNIDLPPGDCDLLKEGILDSLSFVDLLLYLEEEFGVSISLDDLDLSNFRSVTHISAYIAERSAFASLH